MTIHKEGFKIIPIAFFFLALLDAIIYISLKQFLIFYFLMAASLVLAGLVVYFFRVPNREININENHILSPADGKVVVINKVFEKEYFKDERIQVSIFMSPLNVHQNRAPIGGEISYIKHFPGAFYPAYVEKSSELNERCSTVFKLNNGTEVLSRQIAGTVARRICNYKNPGDLIEQGDEYGFIRFGSRVDLFLPLNAKVAVKLDEKPVGGKTIIATF
ncbi:MAG: phosphatidylserine decarboxylase family protein [Prolixibacteraceae bacterium]|jgi:phosphatidylserine decarboxylase|nr:phosphatidylserine decarboxylase family protein [Prolixibacteraceae bacterium]MBT6766593.1 phosphatidylserine decarboxylase family protein [Prolixibacteraceae bacterium]MBT6998314.1 phosphatidylserine decarboxylase family protein [Prolixibacteraceae bacterium]MBT7396440.1 phosphatidylserine decarboxylase family protein [Prolixibacteraceae bacterium]